MGIKIYANISYYCEYMEINAQHSDPKIVNELKQDSW